MGHQRATLGQPAPPVPQPGVVGELGHDPVTERVEPVDQHERDGEHAVDGEPALPLPRLDQEVPHTDEPGDEADGRQPGQADLHVRRHRGGADRCLLEVGAGEPPADDPGFDHQGEHPDSGQDLDRFERVLLGGRLADGPSAGRPPLLGDRHVLPPCVGSWCWASFTAWAGRCRRVRRDRRSGHGRR